MCAKRREDRRSLPLSEMQKRALEMLMFRINTPRFERTLEAYAKFVERQNDKNRAVEQGNIFVSGPERPQ